VLSTEIASLKMLRGFCFSADGRTPYIADSSWDIRSEARFDQMALREVYAFPLSNDRHVTAAGRAVARASKGVRDRIQCDQKGYLWVTTGLGLECLHERAGRTGAIETPESLADLAFGGTDGAEMMLSLAITRISFCRPSRLLKKAEMNRSWRCCVSIVLERERSRVRCGRLVDRWMWVDAS